MHLFIYSLQKLDETKWSRRAVKMILLFFHLLRKGKETTRFMQSWEQHKCKESFNCWWRSCRIIPITSRCWLFQDVTDPVWFAASFTRTMHSKEYQFLSISWSWTANGSMFEIGTHTRTHTINPDCATGKVCASLTWVCRCLVKIMVNSCPSVVSLLHLYAFHQSLWIVKQPSKCFGWMGETAENQTELFPNTLARTKVSESVSAFTYTVKLSYGYSSIRPFNWTTVLVPVFQREGEWIYCMSPLWLAVICPVHLVDIGPSSS